MSQPKKILFLTNIISPYMHDFFNRLGEYKEIDFEVIALIDREPDREWDLDYLKRTNYNYKIIKDTIIVKDPTHNRFCYFGGISILKDIFLKNYSTVIFKGGTRLIGPFYAILSRLLGKKTILWEEANTDGLTPIKKVVKSIYVNKCIFTSFIAYGTRVDEFLKQISPGIEDKIHFAYSPVDNDKFRNRYLYLKSKKNLIRKALGIKENHKIILYIGRFASEKNLFTLIDAIDLIRKKQQNITCLMVGGGNLDIHLKKYVKTKNLENTVRLLPFQQFKKLTHYYTVGDVFVLPSQLEPWGLVINEAMNFDLPVVVSNKVGCGPDIVKSDYNGFIFPYNKHEELANSIIKTLNSTKPLGTNSYKMIKDKDFDQLCRTIISMS